MYLPTESIGNGPWLAFNTKETMKAFIAFMGARQSPEEWRKGVACFEALIKQVAGESLLALLQQWEPLDKVTRITLLPFRTLIEMELLRRCRYFEEMHAVVAQD